MQKFNTQQMNEAVNEAYEKFRGDDGGKNADYIPFLANVPSQLFGISVCLPDGEIVEAGDTDYVFGIESVSKVPTAVLAMRQYGPDTVLDQIGADATGLPFNSIMAILLENDHPSTPLVNAGALTACSMVKPVGDAGGKWKAITDFLEKLCGSPLVLQDELYKSESETNFNNPLTGGDSWDNSSNRVAAEILTEGSATNRTFKEWLDRLADIAHNLRGSDGKLIPVIFRPFHEHTQTWSWWGASCTTTEEFVNLWKFTVKYLRDTKGVHNFIYAISPQMDSAKTVDDFYFRWPGDE